MTNMSFRKPASDSFPSLVVWELSTSCEWGEADLVGCHSSADIRRVLDQLRDLDNLLLVLTGKEILDRSDLFVIINECKLRDQRVAILPDSTEKITEDIVLGFAEAGIERLDLRVNGHTDEIHEASKKNNGSFRQILNIGEWANEAGLALQIDTVISKNNFMYFGNLHDFIGELNAVTMWNLNSLIATSSEEEQSIDAREAEEILKQMSAISFTSGFELKTTSAPHFRRVLLETIFTCKIEIEQHELTPLMRLGALLRSYKSENDGKGMLFISQSGGIFPNDLLPISAGNLSEKSLLEIYRNSTLFNALRNPLSLGGKCGSCRYKFICGGSRARAYAETGDYLAEDSMCSYEDKS